MQHSASYSTLMASVDAITTALELRDSYTRFHCDRAERLAVELGGACGVQDEDLDQLRIAARFHDVGKIGLSDSVLLKPGRLTEEEWAQIQTHPALGERIVRAGALPEHDAIARVIRHHHEGFDGSGYPDGLRGEAIPLLSRILLVADAYDAMGTTRPYHAARNHCAIMKILDDEKGGRIDPEIFREFARLIGRSPNRVQ
jgi:HD-GYP domain-containing protein (c-di-GMP phosphodiesterase class II)